MLISYTQRIKYYFLNIEVKSANRFGYIFPLKTQKKKKKEREYLSWQRFFGSGNRGSRDDRPKRISTNVFVFLFLLLLLRLRALHGWTVSIFSCFLFLVFLRVLDWRREIWSSFLFVRVLLALSVLVFAFFWRFYWTGQQSLTPWGRSSILVSQL